MWDPQVAALDGEIPVVAPNFPGCGGTEAGGDVVTMDAAADAAARAARDAGLDRVVVCGLGMGGYAALSFWRRHRALVGGLVLASARATAEDEASREGRRELADWLRKHGLGILTANLPPLLSAEAPPGLWDHVASIVARQSPAGLAACLIGMSLRADSTPDLAGIDVPALVITSTGDAMCPPSAVSRLASQVPGARLEVLRGPGQLSNLEAPEEFNRLLREHLAHCA